MAFGVDKLPPKIFQSIAYQIFMFNYILDAKAWKALI